MSEIISKTKSDLSLRAQEVKAGGSKSAAIKTYAATILQNFVVETTKKPRWEIQKWIAQARRLSRALINLHKVCSENKMMNGIWIYADYYFSGINIDYKQVDTLVKQGKIPWHACYFADPAILAPFLARLDEDIRKYKDLIKQLEAKEEKTQADTVREVVYKKKLASNDLNPLCFEADPRVENKMIKFMDALKLWDFQIDEESKKNIADAYIVSQQTWKKLILNCNHSWHTDANIISLLWRDLVDQGTIPWEKDLPKELQKKVRLLCGFYMAMTPWVRTYMAWSNVLLVPWVNDVAYFKETLQWLPEWHPGRGLFLKLQKLVLTGFAADADHEVMVVFSWAGRGEYGGLKDSIPWGMKPYMENKDCVYVDVHIAWSEKMRPAKKNILFGAHNFFQPQEVKVKIWQSYIWGQKNVGDIFNSMVQQRDEVQPEWRGAERLLQLTKDRESVLSKIVELDQQISPYIPKKVRDIVSSYITKEWIVQEIYTDESNENFQEIPQQLIEENNDLVNRLHAISKELNNLLENWHSWEKAKKIKI